MNKILKHLMDPAIERVVKSFLNGLGIKNIKDIDTYQDIIKLGKYQNKQVDLNKIVLLSYQLLEKDEKERPLRAAAAQMALASIASVLPQEKGFTRSPCAICTAQGFKATRRNGNGLAY